MNGVEPGGSSLPEADRSDMEYYIAQMELVLPALGLDVLRPAPSAAHSAQRNNDSPTFALSGGGYRAQMQVIDGEFVLRANSVVRAGETPTCPHGVHQRRETALREGLLGRMDDPASLCLQSDIAFPSPSAAAAFVYGGSING